MPDKIGSAPPPTFSSDDGFDEPAAKPDAACGDGWHVLDASRSLGWRAERAFIDATCLALPCEQALVAAKMDMPDGGLAEAMLDHFRLGGSAPVEVNLNAELARNPRLKEFVAGRIEQELAELHHAEASVPEASGAIWVPQSAYGSSVAGQDQQKSFGGTFFEYQAVASADTGDLEVQLNVSDHYFWSPSDCSRTTQCLHECGAQMVAEGDATEFYQHGEGSLIVNDPQWGRPMPLLDIETGEDR